MKYLRSRGEKGLLSDSIVRLLSSAFLFPPVFICNEYIDPAMRTSRKLPGNQLLSRHYRATRQTKSKG